VESKTKFISAIHEILDEYSLDVPWSASKNVDEIHLKMLPPYFSKERLYNEACMKLEEEDRLSRSSFFTLINSSIFDFLKFSKREKGLCDKCVNLRETIRGLQTKSDAISTARRISLERELENHIIRHRMSRHLYRICRSRVQNDIRKEHDLEDQILPNTTNLVHSQDVLNELKKLKENGQLEDIEDFEVHAPFIDNERTSMISWDYARHLSIPHKAKETMGEHFASTLGYNAYLFGIVDECTEKQYNYIYGEEHNSKGSNNVCSMVYHFLKYIASEKIKKSEHLIVFIDGCGGENKNRTVCAFLRSILYAGILPDLKKITVIFMEVGHTKFAPDAGFGLIRRFEKNMDVEEFSDLIKLISNSTPQTSRNIGVLFEGEHFYNWNHAERFRPVPAIRKQMMIQFVKSEENVLTRTRTNYRGKWKIHGTMLKTGHKWFDSIEEDLISIPIPTLTPSRIKHIHQTIIPHIRKDALPWWNSIAPKSIAKQELERINGQKEPRRKKKRTGSKSVGNN